MSHGYEEAYVDTSIEAQRQAAEDAKRRAEHAESVQMNLEAAIDEIDQGWVGVDAQALAKDMRAVAEKNGLGQDEQTRLFISLLTMATNFASLDLSSRMRQVPLLVSTLR